MELPLALPSGRNWRTTALAAAGVAAVELVILLVLTVAAFGLPFAEEKRQQALTSGEGNAAQPNSAAKAAPAASSGRGVAAAQQPRNETSVVVLNGNGITGAADLAAGPLRERSYVLTATGNAPRSDFRRTLVMYRPGFEGEAHRLAEDVGAKRVAPLDGMRGSDLMGAQLALIVGQK